MKRGPLKKNFIPILAAGLILIAGAAFYVAIRSASDLTEVATAAENVPAYTVVRDDDIAWKEVPQGSIVEGQDLTREEYDETYTREEPLITTAQVLPGARFDVRSIADSSRESFSVVSPDERVVATTSTLSGAAIGTINAGDVVDVTQDSTGGTDAAGTSFAKVICIASTLDGCSGVLPSGLSVKPEGEDDPGDQSGPVYVLLAVQQDAAGEIAGRQVNLALNPFCKFGSVAEGLRPDQFYSAREGAAEQCQAPGDRLATTGGSQPAPPTEDDSETDEPGLDEPAPEDEQELDESEPDLAP